MSVVRHFTATAYVVHDGRVALHWHPKVKAWLPPGGHIEENEDPVQAVLRETEEETGLKTVVVPTGPAIDLSYPVLVQPPLTIMVEDIHDPVDGYHQHIDMIYVSRPVGTPGPLNDGWVWGGRDELAGGAAECAIAVGHMSATPECRCSPCVGLRHAMYTMSEATPGPTSTPEPKRGLCVGCGCDGMLVNSACPKCWA